MEAERGESFGDDSLYGGAGEDPVPPPSTNEPTEGVQEQADTIAGAVAGQ